VKNINDLVRINVATIDKSFFVNTRQGDKDGFEQVSYDFKWDPINFRQKVPCMGDRDFLVNQAILNNFSTNARANTGALNRRARNQQRNITNENGMLPKLKQSEADGQSVGGQTRVSIAGVVSDVQSAAGKVYIDGSDPEIDDSYQVDGRGSQLEPVKNL
jgi:hypothetical protein